MILFWLDTRDQKPAEHSFEDFKADLLAHILVTWVQTFIPILEVS